MLSGRQGRIRSVLREPSKADAHRVKRRCVTRLRYPGLGRSMPRRAPSKWAKIPCSRGQVARSSFFPSGPPSMECAPSKPSLLWLGWESTIPRSSSGHDLCATPAHRKVRDERGTVSSCPMQLIPALDRAKRWSRQRKSYVGAPTLDFPHTHGSGAARGNDDVLFAVHHVS
jgi:hypothetical protein